MSTKFYPVQEHDSYKLRAVVQLLENHATYKNLSLQQIEALKEVIQFIKELPAKFDKAPTLEQLMPVKPVEGKPTKKTKETTV